jgi:hypothetical protein
MLQEKSDTLAVHAGGHPDGAGKLWHDGMNIKSTMPEILEQMKKTVYKVDGKAVGRSRTQLEKAHELPTWKACLLRCTKYIIPFPPPPSPQLGLAFDPPYLPLLTHVPLHPAHAVHWQRLSPSLNNFVVLEDPSSPCQAPQSLSLQS